MKRPIYRGLGMVCVALGAIGIFLPLLPTTPFLILAAWFFSRSHPEWEARLLEHPQLGPAIVAWRTRGVIPVVAKLAAAAMLAVSSGLAWLSWSPPWAYLPLVSALLVLSWMLSRPSR